MTGSTAISGTGNTLQQHPDRQLSGKYPDRRHRQRQLLRRHRGHGHGGFRRWNRYGQLWCRLDAGSNIENLVLTGTTAINGTGNALDNVFTGNSAANTLTGGAGNDTYNIGTGDTIVENATKARRVASSVTWTLGTELREPDPDRTRRSTAQEIICRQDLAGQSGTNTLDGAAGAERTWGGAGNDILGGASGSADATGVGNAYTSTSNTPCAGTAGATSTTQPRRRTGLLQENAPAANQDELNFGTGVAANQLCALRSKATT